MTAKEIAKIREKLLSLASRLESDRRQLVEEPPLTAAGHDASPLTDLLDDADPAVQDGDDFATLGIINNEVHLLNDVNSALDRIEQKTYGRCMQCGQSIAKERLQALPYTPHCLECATAIQSGAQVAGATVGE